MSTKTRSEVRLELLIGRMVRDVNGRKVGRIEEVHAHRAGAECVVDSFIVGGAGLAERFGVRILLGAFGVRHQRKPSVIPWQKLDLSDPQRPRLVCAIDELVSPSGR